MNERNQLLAIEQHAASVAVPVKHSLLMVSVIVAVIGERNEFVT